MKMNPRVVSLVFGLDDSNGLVFNGPDAARDDGREKWPWEYPFYKLGMTTKEFHDAKEKWENSRRKKCLQKRYGLH